jgi:hypothetical protein
MLRKDDASFWFFAAQLENHVIGVVSRHTRRDVRRRMDDSGSDYGQRTVPARNGSVNVLRIVLR